MSKYRQVNIRLTETEKQGLLTEYAAYRAATPVNTLGLGAWLRNALLAGVQLDPVDAELHTQEWREHQLELTATASVEHMRTRRSWTP